MSNDTASTSPGTRVTAAAKPRIWKWIREPTVPGGRLYDVGILPDGTLHNPRGYPEHLVRQAVEAANERRHEKRRTRPGRRPPPAPPTGSGKSLKSSPNCKADGHITPGDSCEICGRHLTDPESIGRGIGSDCWAKFILSRTGGTDVG